MIIKKKYNFGVTSSGEIKLVGIEGKKNDRSAWVNYVFDQFFEDFRIDREPTINLRPVINDPANSNIDPELLKIKIKLAKDPLD